MPNNWKTYKLGEITDLIMGQSPKGETTNNEGIGYPLLNGPTEFGYSNPIPIQFTSDAKKLSEVNDLLFCVRGSTTGRMNFSDQVYAIGRGIGVFRGKNGYSTKYVKYLIDLYLDRLLSISTGSTFPNLSKTDILGFELQSCDADESNSIAAILSSLDDKIELNLQMNKTLEEMAMTLYKHWFVDFGPFKDGNFIESELGLIPEGWEVKSIGDIIVNLSKGTTPRQTDVDQLETSVPFLKVKDISDSGLISESNLELIPRSVHEKQLKRSILKENDILLSIAGTIGRVSIVPQSLSDSNCNQALAFIRLKPELKMLSQVYYFFKSPEVQLKIESSIVQGVQANVSLTVLKDLKIVVSPNSSTHRFNEIVDPLFNQIIRNRVENQTLTTLRDTLLPKLISGEVRVKDAEQTVAQAL